jgi:DNA-binding response OmpR family regulator
LKLLLVEDNERVLDALRAALTRHGMDPVCATTGKAALELVREARPDAVLLDIGLPDCDGFAVCSAIREISSVPIVVTTARADPASCVRGLDLGADDYMVKPYNLAELLARVRAVLRRRRPPEPVAADPPPHGLILAGPVRIDLAEGVVLVDGVPTDLSEDELGVLVALARRPGETLRVDQLVDEILRSRPAALHASVRRSVATLRERLGVRHVVEAVEGTGYRLAADGP